MNEPIAKYPRTHHLEGSRLQPGDEDLSQLRYADLPAGLLVAEEKLDGANAALSFTPAGELRLQSRGHYLVGGGRERHFAFFKAWADCHRRAFWDRLGDRHVVYGEWLYAKHTIFYDRLPHYFLEFDVLDRQTGQFLSTARRRALLAGLPIVSVPVLWQGHDRPALAPLIRPSLFKSAHWREQLAAVARAESLEPDLVARQTDPANEAEGLYLKIETDDDVLLRCKLIRASFLTSVVESGSHWLARPILPNQLAPDVDLFTAR
jgi:hypothetical protein